MPFIHPHHPDWRRAMTFMARTFVAVWSGWIALFCYHLGFRVAEGAAGATAAIFAILAIASFP